ncbi:hypothetical protein M404DRAFT_24275 [Pisolithus tinctorius Marx 270]|uniref:Uncharacterized protein n=1 Tax=Pisolithus tinctorius Marx 270 TaxID=870435 RepID=A0A0C3PGV4_PISTI|nr:hypothetical protein M404DRAFT_24275 [Pisolithus tinctorius Marx 270]
MGRTAKYFTLHERQAAERRQKAIYASTKGKELRPAQNHRAYHKRAGRHLSKDALRSMIPSVSSIIHPSVISSVPSLLPALIAYATIPLPMSPLFLEAAESADALDESDLLKWEREPPYTYAEPDPTPEEQRFTCNLVDVMLRRRARLLGEADTH